MLRALIGRGRRGQKPSCPTPKVAEVHPAGVGRSAARRAARSSASWDFRPNDGGLLTHARRIVPSVLEAIKGSATHRSGPGTAAITAFLSSDALEQKMRSARANLPKPKATIRDPKPCRHFDTTIHFSLALPSSAARAASGRIFDVAASP